ncbi:kinetochore protein SPC24 homolog [Musa acuminata AAA Group]
MANLGKRVDIENLLSLGDDLLGVLKNKKDVDGLMQSLEGAKLLHFSCSSDSNNTGKWIEDCQNKIQACEEKIDRSKDETSYDSELDHLQHELDEKLQEEHMLQQELRAVRDELIDLEHQRVSIEDRRVMIKKTEKDLIRARNCLSMCASVTNIIPDFEDWTRISGMVIDRNKKKVEKFEFERTESPLNVCNKLWKMA